MYTLNSVRVIDCFPSIMTNSDEGLKRVIGVPGLTLTIISGVIGAGIFVLPATVGNALGAFSLFAYIACGILFATILFCYAEIGSRITSSGGSYAEDLDHYLEKEYHSEVIITTHYGFRISIPGENR